jgi:succinylglutamate desuccinylase
MENSAVVVCLHGDELFGLEVIDNISKEIPVFIGNPLAIENKKRFMDTDLNRAFPGKEDGNYEEKRAVFLLDKIKDFKCVIDIHSSSGNMELFGIITKPNDEKMELAKKLGLKKLVIMPSSFASGGALIDHVGCGMSLEIGPHEKKENVDEVIKAINNSSNGFKGDVKTEIYEVFDMIKGEENVEMFIKNFEFVKKGDLIARGEKEYYAEFDFYPIFVGEKAYKGILCLATKIINLSDLQ